MKIKFGSEFPSHINFGFDIFEEFKEIYINFVFFTMVVSWYKEK